MHASYFFWIIADDSWLFLIIPDYSYLLQGHYYSDYCRLFHSFYYYSDNSHYSDYCLTMLTKCRNWNYCMLVLPLTGAFAEVSDGDDIPHAQEVLQGPLLPPTWCCNTRRSSSKNVMDYCDHCNYCDNCDYCKYVILFRLLHLCNLKNRNNHNNWNNLNNQNNRNNTR